MQDAFGNGSTESYCTSMFGCFLSVLNLGLRAGGGMGDALQPNFYEIDDPWPFIGRVIFDLSFFIIVITILLNLIFGMIIDAFGTIRDKRADAEDDQQNNCFICGISRSTFERFMDFGDHTHKEHNLWNYLYFIVYCTEKYDHNNNDLNWIENYVMDKHRAKLYDWLPISRSLTLEAKQEQERNEDIVDLKRSVRILTSDLRQFKTSNTDEFKQFETKIFEKISQNPKIRIVSKNNDDASNLISSKVPIEKTLAHGNTMPNLKIPLEGQSPRKINGVQTWKDPSSPKKDPTSPTKGRNPIPTLHHPTYHSKLQTGIGTQNAKR